MKPNLEQHGHRLLRRLRGLQPCARQHRVDVEAVVDVNQVQPLPPSHRRFAGERHAGPRHVVDRVALRDVRAWVERFDRRGIEPFELFRSEFGDFGQNSFKIQEFSLENSNNSENLNIF